MTGRSRPAGTGLLDRGGELARVEQTIEALARGQGGVLVIQGAAGIGKSYVPCASRPASKECRP